MRHLLLIMRVAMELGVVAGLASWGASMGDSIPAKIALGGAAASVGFGFWGAVDFRQAGRLAEPLRLGQELAVSLVAALAWYAAGSHAPAIPLAALSVGYHALVYASGHTLLERPAR